MVTWQNLGRIKLCSLRDYLESPVNSRAVCVSERKLADKEKCSHEFGSEWEQRQEMSSSTELNREGRLGKKPPPICVLIVFRETGFCTLCK